MSTGKKSILTIYLRSNIFNIKENIRVFFKYYKKFKFFLVDSFIFIIYFFISPYRISKNFLKKEKYIKNIHIYGETPLSTFEKIIKEGNLSKKDLFIELGSGRGRCSFFAYYFIKCKTLAIEKIPFFYKTSNFLSNLLKTKNLEFKNLNFLDLSYNEKAFIYLYGTCMEKKEIVHLLKNLKNLPKNSTVATISYPLTDYSLKEFEVAKSFEVEFCWGKTRCYLNRKL